VLATPGRCVTATGKDLVAVDSRMRVNAAGAARVVDVASRSWSAHHR
jgi:hypothetical protein